MTRRPSRRDMLIPKPRQRTRFIPVLPESELAFVIGKLAPPERKALAQICETADLLLVDGRPWLLLPADNKLLDTLAAFGAEAEDREPEPDDEVEVDDDSDNDNAFDSYVNTFGEKRVLFDDREPDCPEARERFIKERQQPGVTCNGITHGRYDGGKDWDESRRVKTALARLPARR